MQPFKLVFELEEDFDKVKILVGLHTKKNEPLLQSLIQTWSSDCFGHHDLTLTIN